MKLSDDVFNFEIVENSQSVNLNNIPEQMKNGQKLPGLLDLHDISVNNSGKNELFESCNEINIDEE